MQASNAPSKSAVPFANSGTKNTIPVASQIGVTPGAASFTDGFPPLTMTPLAAGGVPPYGADFNGILNFLSSAVRWDQAGGGYIYDSAFATSVGGYPKGALLVRADLNGYWLNTVDNNTSNPDSGGAGWINPFSGRLIGVQVFETAGTFTYTPTPGTNFVIPEVQGGGGAGGGTAVTGVGTVAVGGGGGAGGYASSRITSGFSGVTITVGAGGTGVAAGVGGAGGTSSFGALLTATGGAGGPGGAGTPAAPWTSGGGLGGNGTGGNISNRRGGQGDPSFALTTGSALSGGKGGFSILGGAGGPTSAGNAFGNNSANYGAGGSGVAMGQSQASVSGGNGFRGIVIVWEYA